MSGLFATLFVTSLSFSAMAAEAVFTLESSTFKDGGPIPPKHAMNGVSGGQNISPALSWKNPPPGTKSFAIACIDTHPIAKRWVHWIAFGIPADCKAIPEGASLSKMPDGTLEMSNTFGGTGWGGPMPPPGSGTHHYVFTIYALSSDGNLKQTARMDESEFLRAVGRITLGKATITGTFGR